MLFLGAKIGGKKMKNLIFIIFGVFIFLFNHSESLAQAKNFKTYKVILKMKKQCFKQSLISRGFYGIIFPQGYNEEGFRIRVDNERVEGTYKNNEYIFQFIYKIPNHALETYLGFEIWENLVGFDRQVVSSVTSSHVPQPKTFLDLNLVHSFASVNNDCLKQDIDPEKYKPHFENPICYNPISLAVFEVIDNTDYKYKLDTDYSER